MKTIVLSLICIGVFFAKAQDKNQFYALDAKMNQTVLDSSKYILWIHEVDSAKWQWDYYYTWGSLVKSTNYADHDGTVKNGRFCIYNTFGNLDSTGVYNNGKKDGVFLKFRSVTKDSIEFLSRYEYENDSLIGFTNLKAEEEKQADTASKMESGFPGGDPGWLSYLAHNLMYPERAAGKNIQGKVHIYFLVDTVGLVKDPFIFKSVEYSLDQESMRLVKNSGRWVPGKKNGNPLTSHSIKSITYRLEDH